MLFLACGICNTKIFFRPHDIIAIAFVYINIQYVLYADNGPASSSSSIFMDFVAVKRNHTYRLHRIYKRRVEQSGLENITTWQFPAFHVRIEWWWLVVVTISYTCIVWICVSHASTCTLYAFIMEVMVRWEALTANEWRALSKLNFAFLC